MLEQGRCELRSIERGSRVCRSRFSSRVQIWIASRTDWMPGRIHVALYSIASRRWDASLCSVPHRPLASKLNTAHGAVPEVDQNRDMALVWRFLARSTKFGQAWPGSTVRASAVRFCREPTMFTRFRPNVARLRPAWVTFGGRRTPSSLEVHPQGRSDHCLSSTIGPLGAEPSDAGAWGRLCSRQLWDLCEISALGRGGPALKSLSFSKIDEGACQWPRPKTSGFSRPSNIRPDMGAWGMD